MKALLLLAYGTPERPEDVGPYFTHIRGGKEPPADRIAELRARYELIGGRTPLLEITNAVAAAVADRVGMPVYVGMKHWHPFIADVMRQMRDDGVTEILALTLAPHYSRGSIAGYRRYIDAAQAELHEPFALTFLDCWHLQPEFLALIARRVADQIALWPVAVDVHVVFTAHSLPERIRASGDPYETQLLASSQAVADALGLRDWTFAYQSASDTGEPWLGPDICDHLEDLHGRGVRDVVVCSIGFVADHLEIAYDIDYEAQQKASTLAGMTLRRTAMPNADPAFIDALVAIVETAATDAACYQVT